MEIAGMPSSSLPIDISDRLHNPSRVLQLLVALQAAEQSNRENSRFLSIASRDLRQLLQRLSAVDVAMRRLAPENELAEGLLQQEQAVDAMSRLLFKLELRAGAGDADSVMPIVRQTEIDWTRQKPADRSGGPASHATRVLLVEDDRAVCDATRMLLRTDGFEVAVAGSLSEALVQAAHQPSIQLLITNYQLGNNETGLQVITAVRQRVARELKAIVMTSDTSTARHALKRDDCLRVANKPVDADTFLLLVSELAGR